MSTATNGRIAFSSNRDGDYEIYSMDASGETASNQAVPLTRNKTFDDGEPAWSPDGTKIAFTSNRDGDDEIYVMDASGESANPVVQLTTNTTAVDSSPTWSPDATQIAFESNRDGDYEIYKMNANGTGVQTNITNLADAVDVDPAWSRNGTKIAFTTNRFGGDNEIYKMNPDGTEDLPVNQDNSYNDQDPFWSADGRQIGFTSDRQTVTQDPGIYANDGYVEEYQLSSEPGAAEGAWGPNGLNITFGANGDGDYEIYSHGLAVVGLVKLTNNTFSDESPDWQPVYPGYPRPKGATPMYASLVPAYNQCTSPNRTHGPPLASKSCNPPAQSSGQLTVGSPDVPGNGQVANAIGSLRLDVVAGNPATTADEADVNLNVSITDVRCKQVSGGCTAALADYTGQLQVSSTVQITDKLNGPTQTIPGTTGDVSFRVTVSCAATSDTSVGSTCSASTTADAVLSGTVREGKRTIWQAGQIEVYDGGSDGVVSTTTPPNTLFAKQGIFVP